MGNCGSVRGPHSGYSAGETFVPKVQCEAQIVVRNTLSLSLKHRCSKRNGRTISTKLEAGVQALLKQTHVVCMHATIHCLVVASRCTRRRGPLCVPHGRSLHISHNLAMHAQSKLTRANHYGVLSVTPTFININSKDRVVGIAFTAKKICQG